MSYNHQHHYGHQQAGVPMYPEHGEYADIDEPAVSDARPEIFPVSHPLFTREEISNTRALDPYPPSQSPQSWTPYEPPFHHQSLSYASYPSPSPFPPPRLSPPPSAQTFQFKAPGQGVSAGSASHRLTLAGSLDPATGIFYRTPEHPRLRTAQACEKCRTRKAKCSGEHPSCKRCITRGLICEYAKEGRVRGPNKPKPKTNATSTASPSASTSSTSTSTSLVGQNETTPSSSRTGDYGSRSVPRRPPSSHSSEGSSDQTPNDASGQSLFLPPAPGDRSEYSNLRASSSSPPSSGPSFSRGHHLVTDLGPSTSISRHNSFDEHRSSRSRLMQDAHLDTASSLFRLSGASIADETGLRFASSDRSDIRTNDVGSSMGVRSLPEDTQFYPYQQHSLLQHLHRPVHENVYQEISSSRSGQHLQRYQHLDQQQHQHHQERNIFPMPVHQQHGSAHVGGEIHALSPVTITQPRRISSMRIGTTQDHQTYPTQKQISPHQHFGGHQPQQLNLVPIQPGLNIPGGDHRTTPRHGTRGEFAYPHSPVGGMPFFQARGYPVEHPRPGTVLECGPNEHQNDYHLHDPYKQSDAPQQQQQQQQRSLSGSQFSVPQIHHGPQHPQPEYLSEHQSYGSRNIMEPYASPRTVSTSSSTSTVDPSSPMTPVSASTSGGDMLNYHYAAVSNAPSTMDRELHGMQAVQPSGSTASSLASFTSTHGPPQSRPEGGGELHGSHSAGGGEGENRLVDDEAVQQRGSGLAHGASSVSGNLVTHETGIRNGHNTGGHVYGCEGEGSGHFHSGEEFKLC